MLDPLILDIIKIGIQIEVSNVYSLSENEIRIKLSDWMEVKIETEFIV